MSPGKDFFFLNRKLSDKLFLCEYKGLVTSHLVYWFIFLIWNLCYIYRFKIYFPNLLFPIPAIFKDIRDLKILDAAAFKNAVTLEGAWVMTATFARDIRTLKWYYDQKIISFFSPTFKAYSLNIQLAKFGALRFIRSLFILSVSFGFDGPPLLTLKSDR